MYNGIDVSEHQGEINWEKVAQKVDFAILRAGYGRGNVDERFIYNAKECERVGLPYGAYWFSYAHTPEMALNEAKYLIKYLEELKPTYPICFDYEYDSYNYAKKAGINVSYNDVIQMATLFCDFVESKGYYAMIYTNHDWLNRCFHKLIERYDIWLADWNTVKSTTNCGILQYTSTGTVEGINGAVDLNRTERNYPKIIENLHTKVNHTVIQPTEHNIQRFVKQLTQDFWQEYINLSYLCAEGKYGDTNYMYDNIRLEGYEPRIVRAILPFIKKVE